MMRILITLISLLCLSCTKNDPWKHTTIPSSSREHDFAKLTYPPHSPHKGIELELVRLGKSVEGYLQVAQFEIPAHQDDPQKATVHIQTEAQSYSLIVDRLDGGQRLHLSDECLDLILYLLHHNSELSIRLGHFTQIYHAQNFHRHYDKLLKYSPRFRPENFVTFELY